MHLLLLQQEQLRVRRKEQVLYQVWYFKMKQQEDLQYWKFMDEQEQRRQIHEVRLQAQLQEQVRREHEAHVRFHHEQEVGIEQEVTCPPLWPRLPFVMLPHKAA